MEIKIKKKEEELKGMLRKVELNTISIEDVPPTELEEEASIITKLKYIKFAKRDLNI